MGSFKLQYCQWKKLGLAFAAYDPLRAGAVAAIEMMHENAAPFNMRMGMGRCGLVGGDFLAVDRSGCTIMQLFAWANAEYWTMKYVQINVHARDWANSIIFMAHRKLIEEGHGDLQCAAPSK